jgi:glycerophosphoryl diester phosphodiesterase
MPAFQRAYELGVTAIETDVHMTKDGHCILVHDPSAARTGASSALWSDLTLQEAKSLDVGWAFVDRDGHRPFAGKNIRIVTLDELIATFDRVRFNIDIKPSSRVATLAVLEIVRRRKAESRVTLASFSSANVKLVRRSGYTGETCLSRRDILALHALPARFWLTNVRGAAAQVPLRHELLRFDSASFIARCHARGVRVDYWTVDDVETARRLLALGADGIVTNDPAALLPLFAAPVDERAHRS